ncbi:hypothetical protein B4Q13_25470, partial [Lacticaseibacillus rhamnosus]
MLQSSVLPGTSTPRAMQGDGTSSGMTKTSQFSSRAAISRGLTARWRAVGDHGLRKLHRDASDAGLRGTGQAAGVSHRVVRPRRTAATVVPGDMLLGRPSLYRIQQRL